jgi:hypothetical protein
METVWKSYGTPMDQHARLPPSPPLQRPPAVLVPRRRAVPVTSLQYTDNLAPGFPTRFYRAVWSP